MTLISDYGLIGDCQSGALVSAGGSIDWWCPARFDSPSVFGALLDESAGSWSIQPAFAQPGSRRYLDGTMVLQTSFDCDGATLQLTDALAFGEGERGHQIGAASPHALVRQVEAIDGDVDVTMQLSARPEFGLVTPSLVKTSIGVEISGSSDRMLLSGDQDFEIDAATVTASFSLRHGESAIFVLHHRSAAEPAKPNLDGRAVLANTLAGWRSWSDEHSNYRGLYRAEVDRSSLVLQALTYRPTGAIVAAPTTSLPEEVGGTANWDYRYSWLRDGSFTLKALWVAACPDEAQRFFDWMADSSGPILDGRVPVMFAVGGEHDLTEHELDHLSGYADSRPVRIGNEAWGQKQLDVMGEVLECAWILRDQLSDIPPTTAAFLVSLADRAASAWKETDAGIWEGREGERHYLTSKLMCWVAVDRAIRLCELLNASDRSVEWKSARDEIRTEILKRGWSDEVGAFTGAFESEHLDAGVLLMPIVGFLPADDERVLATLEVIERNLSVDGLVQRWTDAGDEGSFLICSYWLATGWALAGQVDRAKTIFERATQFANDLGLLSEEVKPKERTLIGNFPQGLSHIGLINAAFAIDSATHTQSTTKGT